jgi:hypothetical protein
MLRKAAIEKEVPAMKNRTASMVCRLLVLVLFWGAVALPMANAQEVDVTPGMLFDIDAAWVGLPSYSDRPKLSCTYRHVLTDKQQKASSKLWTYTPGTLRPTFLWTKKMRLYHKGTFIERQKNGSTIADWLRGGFQSAQPMTGIMASAELDPPVNVSRILVLEPPRVERVLDPVGGQYTLQGQWFGPKKPKVWIEYISNNDFGSVKRLRCKVLPPTAHVDAKGKPAYMGVDGSSEVTVQMWNGRHPNDLLDYVGNLVIDNGIGLHYGTYAP